MIDIVQFVGLDTIVDNRIHEQERNSSKLRCGMMLQKAYKIETLSVREMDLSDRERCAVCFAQR